MDINGRAVTFRNADDEELKRRMAIAKQQGWSDEQIQRSALIEKTVQKQQQIQAQQQAAQQQAQQVQQKKPSGVKRLAVNAGAIVGSAAAGIGALAAAPVTGGVSLAGGVAAGAGIEALRRKLLGEKQSAGASALEGALTLLPGAAKGIKAISGATKTAKTAEEVVGTAQTANKEKEALKQTLINSFKSKPTEGVVSSRINQAGETVKAQARGVVPGIKPEGAASRLRPAQADEINQTLNNVPVQKAFGRTSTGTRGNVPKQQRQVGAAMEQTGKQIDDLVEKNNLAVKPKKLTEIRDSALEDIVGKNGSGVLGMKKMHNDILTELDTKLANVKDAKGLIQLKREIQGKVNFARNPSTPDQAAEKIYETYRKKLDNAISSLSPELKQANTQFSKLKRADDALSINNPATMKQAAGAGIQSKVLGGGIAQSVVDKVGRGLTTTAKVTSNPMLKTVAGQGVARAFLKTPDAQGAPQTSEQLPADVSQIFPGSQNPDESVLNELAATGITDPQEMFDALSGQGDYTFDPDNPGKVQLKNPEAETTESGATGASSAELFKMALDLRIAGDTKGAKDILDFAKVAAEFEKESAKSGKGTKVSAAQQKDLGKLGAAENVINQIEQGLGSAGLKTNGPQARLTGVARNVGQAIGTDEQARIFKSQREGYLASLAKSLGEVGSLSDQDIKRARELIPGLGDTQAEAQEKIRRLRELISNNKQTVMSVPASTGGFDDFSNVFNQQGAF